MKKFTQIFIVFFVAIFILSTFFFNQNDTLIDQPKREFNAITNTNDEILVNELENTKNESDTENESDIVKDGSTDYLIDHFNPDLASADFPIAPEISTELSKINNFKVDPKTEILSKRDRTSKHYLREDGKTIDAILSPKSVHYKDEDGSWKDIDTKLLPSEKRDYVFANTANNLQSWFPADLTTYGVIIKTDKAEIVMGENLTMSWGDKNGNPLKSERFRRTKPEVKGNILNYNNVLPYIHNQYVVQQDEIKHNIILEQKPDIINETDFLYFGEGIQLPENYSLQFDQNSEGLVVLDDNGQVYLEIPAPQVYEENNQTVVASAPYASFEIEESPEPGNTYVIIVKVSAEWLNERTFPVVIDPTIILNGNSSGYIWWDYYYSGSGSNATTHRNYNAYNSTSARIALNRNYYYRSSWSWYRSVDYDYYKGWIKYNTSTIPDDKAINQIEFSANISGGYTGNLYTYIYSSSTPGNYSTSTNSSQYNAITAYPHGGTYYSGYGQYPYVVLNTNSNSRLQALLPNDYFQIGLYSNYSTRGGAQTKTFNTSSSLLRVTYESACAGPVVLCRDFTVQLDANGNVEITTVDIDNGSTAECGLQSITLSKTNFTCADVGNNLVTLTVTDVNGAMATCQATVTVEDNIKPVITASSDITQTADAGECGANVTIVDATATDNCSVGAVTGTRSDGLALTASYPVGETTITWTVTDINNNDALAVTQKVTVTDDELPVITASSDITQTADAGECGANVTIVDATATDNCSVGAVTGTRSDGLALTASYPVGETTITWTVTDINNNDALAVTQKVTVTDDELPVITASSDITQTADAGECGANVTIVDATATDNCSVGAVTGTRIDGLALTASYPVGETTITWTVTDINNNDALAVTQKVTVTDDELPVITASSDITQTADAGECGANVTIVDATATDNCSVGAVTGTRIDGLALTASYPVGETTITWTVTDINNNDALAVTQKVTVTDDELPVITASSDITQTADAGECGANVTIVDATATDNCSVGAVTGTRIDGLALTASYPVGETTITWTVTDINNNDALAVTQKVTVTDDELPVITASSDITQTADAGECGANVTIVDATATDNCSVGAVTGTRIDGLALTASYPVGETTITWTVTDINNNDALAVTQKVTVTDDELPVITASSDITQTADAGECGANVTIVDATATDNCSVGAVTGTRIDGLALTASYPVGETTITWTVTDINNNDALAVTQKVTVTDDELPVITASSDITQTADAGECGANVTIVDATATDNCSVGAVTGTRSDGLALTASYPVGETTITWTVTDINNNDALAVTQKVTVTDDELPVITASSDITQTADAGECGANVTIVDATATDNCSVGAVTGTRSDGLALTASYPVGETTITWTVTDINNNDALAVTQKVTVTDDELPVITASSDITQTADAGECGANVTIVDATATDNCSVGAVTGTRIDGLALTASYPVGETTITWTVTDINNNDALAVTQKVTVTDDELPVITASSDITQTADAGECGANVTIVDATATDNCSVGAVTGTRSDGLALTASYPVGETTITWTVTDINNNDALAVTQKVTVTDDELPVITASSDITQTADAGECGANVTIVDATATDNCSVGAVTGTRIDGLALTASYPVGETTITWTVTDINNNDALAVTQKVTVTDDELPVITASSDITQTADAGECGANVTIVDATATDNCSVGAVTGTRSDGLALTASYPVGETTITWTVTDINNNDALAVTQKVTVTDDELPVITASSDITQTADAGECGANVTIVDATATDNCSVGAVTGTRSDGLALTASYPVGETTITWTVTDINNNDALAVTQKVTVTDDELPVITASSDITQTADAGECGANVTIVDATATDNCSVGAVTGTRIDGLALTASYPVGETTITWTVTDINNNDALAVTQKVTVTDDEAPSILGLPSNIVVNNDPLNCSAFVNWTVPTVSDNCGVLSFESSHNSGDTFPEGQTTVTYTATDIHNNVYSASFEIDVRNTLPNNTQGVIGGIYPIQAGTDFYLSADFNDDNLESVSWHFSSDGDFTNGDTAEYSFTYSGGVSGGIVSRMFNFDAAQTGVYTVKVVVTDACGEMAEVKYSYVVIYDPSGGFVTGGGWIFSPVGALVGSNTKGKANFGFVAKYKTGKNNVLTLDGNTNFQFKEGDFHFKSNEYDEMSLVISGGKKATYRGTGTVNRNGSHKFLVTVIDGDATGGDGDDKFRIKIWADGSSSNVIYDNEFNAAENADSNTIIGGGSIVIHKPKGKNNKIDNSDNTLDNQEIVDGLELKSWPNPSDSYFNLKVKSNNNIDNIEIMVFDVTNKLVFKNNFNPNSEYKFGENLEGGMYIVKIVQGDIQKSIRLVKY